MVDCLRGLFRLFDKNRISSISTLLFIVFCFSSLYLDGKEYRLFSRGKTSYTIVVSSIASESEQESAKELQEYLRLISGAHFPIKENAHQGERIIIGYNDIVRSLAPTHPCFDPFDESFTIFSIGGDIFIYGGSIRGTQYGVYDFLEKYFFCEWFTKDVRRVPIKRSWSFNSLNREVSPSFKIRNVYFRSILDKQWVNHSRNSGEELYWGCHTMGILVPADKYFSKHPEYFSLWDGKRRSDAQLCLSNPAVVKICANALKQVINDNPDYLVYDLSQNDNQFPCQCKRCQTIVKEEGSESGPIIRFVNQVADIVKADFPDKYIGTFAYTYSRRAPRNVKPRDNVVIRLCDGECCFSHRLDQCSVNQRFCSDLEDWSNISSNLIIWDYVTPVNEYLLPFPNYTVLQPNIQLFKSNGSIGVIEEGSYRSRVSDLSDLKTYLLTKLLWDDSVDVNALTNSFLNNVYGKASPYIRQYIDYLNSLISEDKHVSKNYHRNDALYTYEMIVFCRKLFTRAEKAADNEDVLNRIRTLRIPVDYLYIRKFPKEALNDGSLHSFRRFTEKEKINWVNRKQRINEMLDGIENP